MILPLKKTLAKSLKLKACVYSFVLHVYVENLKINEGFKFFLIRGFIMGLCNVDRKVITGLVFHI